MATKRVREISEDVVPPARFKVFYSPRRGWTFCKEHGDHFMAKHAPWVA